MLPLEPVFFPLEHPLPAMLITKNATITRIITAVTIPPIAIILSSFGLLSSSKSSKSSLISSSSSSITSLSLFITGISSSGFSNPDFFLISATSSSVIFLVALVSSTPVTILTKSSSGAIRECLRSAISEDTFKYLLSGFF